MLEWGNKRANLYWEANIPSFVRKPQEGDNVRDIQQFIRAKYEHKKYIANEIPPKNNVLAAQATPTQAPPAVPSAPQAKFNQNISHSSGVPIPITNNSQSAPSLLDFTPQAPPVPTFPPVNSTVQAPPVPAFDPFATNDDFGDFSSASASTSTASKSTFDPFSPQTPSVPTNQPSNFDFFVSYPHCFV